DPGLHAVQREARLRLQTVEPRRVLRGPQPHRRRLRLVGAGGCGEPALLRAGRRPRLLRRHPVEVEVMRGIVVLGVMLALAAPAAAGEVRLGARGELAHAGKGHEVHVSAPAVASAADGIVLLTWAAEEGPDKNVYVARAGEPGAAPVRVNPAGLSVEALHHSPLIAAGPGGVLYVSW